jgi:hypothetical protein
LSKPRSRIAERGPHACGSAAEQGRRDPSGCTVRADAMHKTASISRIDAVFFRLIDIVIRT